MTYTGVKPRETTPRLIVADHAAMTIEHPTPCNKVKVGTDSIGRPIWKRELRCILAERIREDENGCWLWQGAKVNGYGAITVNRRTQLAHRVVYELLVGPIPGGYEVDHLCRVPACCAPAHLEAVTPRDNKLRSTTAWGVLHRTGHCVNGHPREGEGSCRRCMAARQQRNREVINARRRHNRRHKNAGEEPCDACRHGEREYQRERARTVRRRARAASIREAVEELAS